MATILIVDDAPLVQRVLAMMLQRINHTIITADNGLEALARLAETPIDLMITDIMMPQMDGLSLLERLRADERHKHLPVIVLTASGQESVSSEAERRGANYFLRQPISSWELKETVENVLQ